MGFGASWGDWLAWSEGRLAMRIAYSESRSFFGALGDSSP